MQATRHKINAPRAPALRAKPLSQTARPHETAGCLDAHHRNAQAADALEVPRRPDLREILDRRQDRAEDPEEVGPPLCMRGAQVHVVNGENEDQDCVQDREERYQESSLVRVR